MAVQPDHFRFNQYFRKAFVAHDQFRSRAEFLVSLVLTAHSRTVDDDADLFPDRVALSQLALSIIGIQSDEPDWVREICSKSSVDLSWATVIFRANLVDDQTQDDLLTLPQSAHQRDALSYALTVIQPVKIDS